MNVFEINALQRLPFSIPVYLRHRSVTPKVAMSQTASMNLSTSALACGKRSSFGAIDP